MTSTLGVVLWLVAFGVEAPTAPRERATRLPLARDEGPTQTVPAEPSPRADSALALLGSGDHARAWRVASSLLEGTSEERRQGRRILATIRFLQGDAVGALAQWNRLGEPRVDAVRIQGSRRAAASTVRRRLGLRDGDVLTPSSLRLAQRRVADLPSLARARVSYRPLPDGSVEVDAAVLERRPTPSLPELVAQGVRGAVSEQVVIEAGPFLGGTERGRVTAGWSGAQRHFGASISAASGEVPGIVTVVAAWRAERYRTEDVDGSTGPLLEESAVTAEAALREWVLPQLRLEGRLGVARWRPGTVMAAAGATSWWSILGEAGLVALDLDGWAGADGAYGRAGVEATLEVPTGSHGAWRLESGATATSADAPRLTWPGAGTGHIREALLRGHPLAADGAIVGPAFAPLLAHATLERRLFLGLGPIRVGASLFLDAAVTRATRVVAGGAWLDPGVSLFVDAGADEMAVSIARGDGRWVTSARVRRWR